MIGPPGAPVEEEPPKAKTYPLPNLCSATARNEKTYSFTDSDENKRSTSTKTYGF